MRFRKLIPIILVAAGLLYLTGCKSEPAPVVESTPITDNSSGPSAAAAGGNLSALGTVRPIQTLRLSFGAAAPVATVHAQLGREVAAGELLAELDTAVLELELERAQQDLLVARAQLDALLDGPAANLVERTEAEHARLVAQAEFALQLAQLRLETAVLQDQAPAVTIAQSDLEQLDLQLAQQRSLSTGAEVVVAQVALTRAQDALDFAQDEYQKALDRPWEPQAVRDNYANAVKSAEQDLQLAQARLAAASGGQAGRSYGLELVSSQRRAAAAQLAQALDAQEAYSLTLEMLAAEVQLAQLELDRLLAWQNPQQDPVPAEELTRARSQVRQAELAVAQLELQLQGARLQSPFAGVISAVYLGPGEWASPGEPVVELVDTSHWVVETRNVGELTIGGVVVGTEARVRVNAFQGELLSGQVVAISPIAVVQQGDTTYTLVIQLEETGLNLRPGMNAQVELLLK